MHTNNAIPPYMLAFYIGPYDRWGYGGHCAVLYVRCPYEKFCHFPDPNRVRTRVNTRVPTQWNNYFNIERKLRLSNRTCHQRAAAE